MQLRTDKHTKSLQRQLGVQESRRLDAAVHGTMGIKGNTGLTDDVIQKHQEARNKRNTIFWKQRAGQVQARRSPNIIAVDPGSTVFVETAAWEIVLGHAIR